MYKYENFWNRIAKKYAAQPVSDQAAYEHKLALTRSLLTEHSRVLEIGCGTGSTALHHAPYAGSILATDFSEEMIGLAEQKRQAAGIDNVEFRREPVEALTRFEERFDMVMAHSLLHLLPDYQTTINMAYERLLPGGYFVSNTACILTMMPLFRFVAPVGHRLGVTPYVNCFDEDTLIQTISDAGFTVAEKWKAHKKSALFLVAQKPG